MNDKAHVSKIEPIDAYCPKCGELLMLPQGTVTREPSVPVSELKKLHEKYGGRSWGALLPLAHDLNYLIHQAEQPTGEKDES